MARESAAERASRALKITAALKKMYPNAHCALDFATPEQLLFATILSAQCTDERVNIVTKMLFKQYPTPFEMAKASLAELQGIVRSTGFFRAKAKSLKHTSEELVAKYSGRVPKDMKALTALRGVGRKTANVVLGNAFGIVSGIVVDTHVTRLSQRLGLTRAEGAVEIEKELMPLIPESNWIQFSHWLIEHGRRVCKARKPACETCGLNTLCLKRGV